jgi:cell division protein FtsI/penicillin-binding protein 2
MTLLLSLLLVAGMAGASDIGSGIGNNIGSDVNYIAVDVRSGAIIEQRWADAAAPIPLGSLVKPFTALAYPGAFPEFVCTGAASRCWLAHGHGRLRFREALAQSCNAYFLNLAGGVDPGTLAVVAAKFGIAAPEVDSAETRIGLGDGWRISPLALVHAYAELASRTGEPRVNEILAGLELAARSGTASAVGREFAKTGTALRAGAKTGTAPCAGIGAANRKHATDGFTMVLAPADSPRIALLVRVHGVTGAEAAKSAARILREMREAP